MWWVARWPDLSNTSPSKLSGTPQRCRRCLTFARTSAGVFHLRVLPGREGRPGGEHARGTYVQRCGFLLGCAGCAVNKFAIFPRYGSSHPIPTRTRPPQPTILRDDFFSGHSVCTHIHTLISTHPLTHKQTHTHTQVRGRGPGKGRRRLHG